LQLSSASGFQERAAKSSAHFGAGSMRNRNRTAVLRAGAILSACWWSAGLQGADTSIVIYPFPGVTDIFRVGSPPDFPLNMRMHIVKMVSNIAPSASASGNVTIDFTGCGGESFTMAFTYSANSGAVMGSNTLYNQFQ
jgi:hypothetical protein